MTKSEARNESIRYIHPITILPSESISARLEIIQNEHHLHKHNIG